VIVSKQATLKSLRNSVPAKEAVALASSPIQSGKSVSELIKWAEKGDLRGATASQLKWIARYVRYHRRKGGLSRKQIKNLRKNRECIEKHQEEVILKEGSLEAVYGDLKDDLT
jgi:hypothetical protein